MSSAELNRLQPPTTAPSEVEQAIARLVSRKQDWPLVGIPQRLAYLQQCLSGVQAVASDWANAVCHAKGIDPATSLAGEAWMAGPVATLRQLRQLQHALAAQGQPVPPQLITRPDGQSVAQVFPDSWLERLLWLGYRGEVWLEPDRPVSQGQIYRQPVTAGQVALVLGAGNISSIPPLDVLYKLFVENQVVLLKMNPVNAYVGPVLEQAFHSLCEAGFLAVVYGGAELGAYLCQHPQIDTVHITGSHQTHDRIVWGATPADQTHRKATEQPQLTKPITSELGCVTPVLVVPGDWSRSEIRFQARHVAGMVAHNASFNCNAAKVLVMAQGWPQRQAFLDQLRQELRQTPVRQAYYPGAQQRYQAFLDHYPQAEVLTEATDSAIPWTLIPNVPPDQGEYALRTEAFCGLLAEVSLPTTDARTFLDQAVTFANEAIWGSLSCVMLIDPRTQKSLSVELDRAIADLRYGGIGINIWSGMIYYLGSTTWGAFPGQPLTDIGSGRGVVHNTYLFDHPQKSVVWAPFRIWPTPGWFATHRNLRQLAQALVKFEAQPGLGNLVRVMRAAIQG